MYTSVFSKCMAGQSGRNLLSGSDTDRPRISFATARYYFDAHGLLGLRDPRGALASIRHTARSCPCRWHMAARTVNVNVLPFTGLAGDCEIAIHRLSPAASPGRGRGRSAGTARDFSLACATGRNSFLISPGSCRCRCQR